MSETQEPSNDGGLIDRFRHIVKTACVNMSEADKQSAPSVCKKLLNGDGSIRSQLVAVNELGNWSINNGFNPLVRRYVLKNAHNVPAAQLALFPDEVQRNLVAEIGTNVYVPERKEFVSVTPGTITADELDSAGRYLIVKGEDTIRRGGMCIRLARRMRQSARRHR